MRTKKVARRDQRRFFSVLYSPKIARKKLWRWLGKNIALHDRHTGHRHIVFAHILKVTTKSKRYRCSITQLHAQIVIPHSSLAIWVIDGDSCVCVRCCKNFADVHCENIPSKNASHNTLVCRSHGEFHTLLVDREFDHLPHSSDSTATWTVPMCQKEMEPP